jgi:hypothetical protein
MCAVSNIGDYGRQTWPTPFPVNPYQQWPHDGVLPAPPAPPFPFNGIQAPYNGPSKEQFEEFLKLLRAAKAFDEATGQPDCKNDEKLDWLKAIAKHLGVPEPKL